MGVPNFSEGVSSLRASVGVPHSKLTWDRSRVEDNVRLRARVTF